jgi:hypothetical protein
MMHLKPMLSPVIGFGCKQAIFKLFVKLSSEFIRDGY